MKTADIPKSLRICAECDSELAEKDSRYCRGCGGYIRDVRWQKLGIVTAITFCFGVILGLMVIAYVVSQAMR